MRDGQKVFAGYLVAVLWWVCFIPGFYSGDSFAVLAQASSGRVSGAYTVVWPLYVRMVSLRGRFPGAVTLLDALLLSYALHTWCKAVLPKRVYASVFLLMAATPLVGAMGITLWHDIPMTAGFLLLAAVATSSAWFAAHLSRLDSVNGFAGAALIAFRPNGLPTLLGFVVLGIVIGSSSRRTALYGTAAMLVGVAVSLAASAMSGNPPLIVPRYAQEWMRADISCMLSKDPGSFAADDRERLSEVGGVAAWTNRVGCEWLSRPAVSRAELLDAIQIVPAVWVHLATAHPFEIVRIHADRHAYLLPIPRPRAFSTPFIHSTIDSGRGVGWLNPRVSEAARTYARVWNAGRGVMAFAGLWFVALVGLALIDWRNSTLHPTILIAVSLLAVLFITAPIADARYALFVLIAGQAATAAALLEWRAGSGRASPA